MLLQFAGCANEIAKIWVLIMLIAELRFDRHAAEYAGDNMTIMHIPKV